MLRKVRSLLYLTISFLFVLFDQPIDSGFQFGHVSIEEMEQTRSRQLGYDALKSVLKWMSVEKR